MSDDLANFPGPTFFFLGGGQNIVAPCSQIIGDRTWPVIDAFKFV